MATDENLVELANSLSLSGQAEPAATTLLLVEGASDVTAVHAMLVTLAKAHRVSLWPLGGGGSIHGKHNTSILEARKAVSKVVAIIDSEKVSPNDDLSKGREAFVEFCRKADVDCHVLERRALENYFPDRAVKTALGGQFRGLTDYELLRDASPHWDKDQNWRIAQEMSVAEIKATDLGRILDAL